MTVLVPPIHTVKILNSLFSLTASPLGMRWADIIADTGGENMFVNISVSPRPSSPGMSNSIEQNAGI